MGIFEAISLILKLLKLWDGFLDFLDKKYTADLEKRRQAREKAIDKSVEDESDEDLFKDQTDIVDNAP